MARQRTNVKKLAQEFKHNAHAILLRHDEMKARVVVTQDPLVQQVWEATDQQFLNPNIDEPLEKLCKSLEDMVELLNNQLADVQKHQSMFKQIRAINKKALAMA